MCHSLVCGVLVREVGGWEIFACTYMNYDHTQSLCLDPIASYIEFWPYICMNFDPHVYSGNLIQFTILIVNVFNPDWNLPCVNGDYELWPCIYELWTYKDTINSDKSMDPFWVSQLCHLLEWELVSALLPNNTGQWILLRWSFMKQSFMKQITWLYCLDKVYLARLEGCKNQGFFCWGGKWSLENVGEWVLANLMSFPNKGVTKWHWPVGFPLGWRLGRWHS